MNKNDETKEMKKREGQNITLTVHDGVIGGQCGLGIKPNFKKVMNNIMDIFTEEKTNGSNDV
jgi:hypothetical protein